MSDYKELLASAFRFDAESIVGKLANALALTMERVEKAEHELDATESERKHHENTAGCLRTDLEYMTRERDEAIRLSSCSDVKTRVNNFLSICRDRNQFADRAEQAEARLAEYERWNEFPAPSLDRVFVAGVQPRHGNAIAYWYICEDVTDENGIPMDNPKAIRWRPLPQAPTENCEEAARAAAIRKGEA